MRSELAVMVLAVAVLGCGDGLSGTPQTQTVRQELTVIRNPTELATWTWGTRLVPTTAKSAYVVAAADPRDPSSFLAWGYDARGAGTALFFVHGKTALHWRRVQQQIEADFGHFQAGGAGFDPAFTWGWATQIYKVPKGPLPGGTDFVPLGQAAFDIALHIEEDLLAY